MFNLLGAIGGLLQCRFRGAVEFGVPADLSAYAQIQLEKKGIRLSWRQLVGDVFFFNVPGDKAAWAEHVLNESGVWYGRK